jgi:hypothetical protein
MITIILADHFKKGMKTQGCVGLLPYDKNKNLFQQQHTSIRSIFPRTSIRYVYGFDYQKFDSFIVDNKYSNIQYILNTNYSGGDGYGLSLVKDEIINHKECLIMHGYEPLSTKKMDLIKKHKKSLALIDDDTQSKLGCIIDPISSTIKHIFFDLDNYISNIYLLKEEEIKILTQLLKDKKTYNMFLFEIVNSIIENNGKIEPLHV